MCVCVCGGGGGGGGVTQFTLVITRDVSRSDCGKNSNCIITEARSCALSLGCLREAGGWGDKETR